ncbi:uncharacterized protein C2845_PM01G44710 [Panicum miliaceum]|uniref:Proline-rich protein 4-like n=1 Tax=Panicum miliaceum TaxID=4540 RepID=A0A3L6TSR1_PANMI|nr:uncharacterized protein C2845_PM01G44710 [Panicum miliaceum]
MGPLPRRLLAGVGAVLLVTVLAHAAEPEMASMVVGLAKCADCTRKNMKAEAAFNGLKVAVKCKNAVGVFETKALGEVDKSGAFSVPLTADLLREDGELKQDCFAQLHSTTNQPCPGQEPSWIVRPSSDDDKKKSFVQKTQNPETDPAKFKKLLPFIKKNPFFFPKFPKFPPGKEEIKV